MLIKSQVLHVSSMIYKITDPSHSMVFQENLFFLLVWTIHNLKNVWYFNKLDCDDIILIKNNLFKNKQFFLFVLQTHQIWQINFFITILTKNFAKYVWIVIKNIVCKVWCIFRPKWIFHFSSRRLQTETSVN